jgi:hypothetical protein
MYRIFWLEDGEARSEGFASDGLSGALGRAEALRRRQRAGERVSFVTIASENPDQVGPPGVDDPAADYAWVKRRPPRRMR